MINRPPADTVRETGALQLHPPQRCRGPRSATRRQIEKLGFQVTTNTTPLTQQLPHTVATPRGHRLPHRACPVRAGWLDPVTPTPRLPRVAAELRKASGSP